MKKIRKEVSTSQRRSRAEGRAEGEAGLASDLNPSTESIACWPPPAAASHAAAFISFSF